MRVTTGIWFTPAGVALAGDGGGLLPDLEVELADAQIGADDDPVLAAGLQTVRTLSPEVSR